MKELDEITIITIIGELKVAYDENIKLAKEYYMQAKVYEYLIECLKKKL